MTTPTAGLPEWAAAQASPWVQLNAALRVIDAFLNGVVVEEMDRNAPPGTCPDGARYHVGPSPSGAFVGHADELAVAQGANAVNGWKFATIAREGTDLYDKSTNLRWHHDGVDFVIGPAGGAGRLMDLSDVNESSVADGYVLKWDLSNGEAYWGPDQQAGSSGGTFDIPVMAAAMKPRTTNGPSTGSSETATNKVMQETLDYDASTAEYAQFMLPMPKSWNELTVTAKLIWTAANTGDVVWGIQAVAISDDDPMDSAFGTAQTVTDSVTAANDVMHTAFTGALTVGGTPAERDLVIFQVYRDAAAGGDTVTVDAKLLGVVIRITTDAGDDS